MPATYEPIATTTLGTAGQIAFTSIPSSYTDLRLVLVGTALNSFDHARMRFNSDTGTNYSSTELYTGGAAVGSIRNTNTSFIYVDAQGGGMSSTIPGFMTVDIFSYTDSSYKTCLTTGNEDTNGTGYVSRGVGVWRNTSAITRIDLLTEGGTPNFKAGTTATLYGILKA